MERKTARFRKRNPLTSFTTNIGDLRLGYHKADIRTLKQCRLSGVKRPRDEQSGATLGPR
jgi:hypothetical protein